MSEDLIDTIGKILWIAIFATPFLTVPLAWKFLKIKKIYRIIIGLALALFASFFLYHISLAIIFRHGMGS